MEFDKYFIVGLNFDEETGKRSEINIEQRFNPQDADACSGWMRRTLGYEKVFVYGGTPLRWVGPDQGQFAIYEGQN